MVVRECRRVGTALMEDERVTKLSFTGSTAIGKVRKEGNCEMCGEEREWRGNRGKERERREERETIAKEVYELISPATDGRLCQHSETSLTGARRKCSLY